MSDLDPVRGLFSGAKGDVVGLVKPPGAADAVARARYRRRARTAALGLVALLVLILLIARPFGFGLPPNPSTPTPSPTPGSPSPSPSASPSPTPAPTESPSASGGPGENPQAGALLSTPTKAPCVKRGYAWEDIQGDTRVVSGIEPGNTYYRICPGETIRVWVVEYHWDPDGWARPADTKVAYLTYDKPSVTWPYVSATDCVALVSVGAGNVAFPDFRPGVQPQLPGFVNGKGFVHQTYNGTTAPAACLATPTP